MAADTSPYQDLVVQLSPRIDDRTVNARSLEITGATASIERAGEGRYRLVPDAPLAPGPHEVRVRFGKDGVRGADGSCGPGEPWVRTLHVRSGPPLRLRASIHDSDRPDVWELTWEDIRADAFVLEEQWPDGSWHAVGPSAPWSFRCVDTRRRTTRVTARLPSGALLPSTESVVACPNPLATGGP